MPSKSLLHFLFLFLSFTQAFRPLKVRSRLGQSISDSDEEYGDYDVQVGEHQEDDEVCDDYATCSERGLGYWNALHTTLFNAQPSDRTDGYNIFHTYYETEFDGVMVADPDLRQGLANRGVSYENMDVWYTFSMDPKTGHESFEKAYFNVFDTANGVIIAEGNWRELDEQKRLPWSELMYQTWQVAKDNADVISKTDKSHPPGGPISNLRSVIQHIITNMGTQAVLRAAYQSRGYSIGQGDQTWQKWTEADTPYFFYGLLGTDNCKGTVWLLNDHAAEIGKKEVSVIWTRWTTGSPDIWYVLTSPASSGVLCAKKLVMRSTFSGMIHKLTVHSFWCTGSI